MAKRPAEIFGYPIDSQLLEAISARKAFSCQYANSICNKQSRIINYPMGVCSVLYNGETIALCPRRFLAGNKVFQDIADKHFGTRNDLIVFSEIGLESIGTFDFIMVKHRPMSSQIEDFVAIEFQTGQTTGTGGLVNALKDFMAGVDIQTKSYGFGLNLYDIWKRSFTQILNKGIVMEAWKRKIYWVVQQQVFQDLVDRYHLGEMNYSPNNFTVFSLYDLKRAPFQYDLVPFGLKSSSVDALFNAFRNNPAIPERKEFEDFLSLKMKANIGFTITS